MQKQLLLILGAIPLSGKTTQADPSTDTVIIDPLVGSDAASLGMVAGAKMGNGVSVIDGKVWWFIVDESEIAAVQNLAAKINGIT